jgi:hypothetical protein
MAALDFQYTAYKGMLSGLAGDTLMDVTGINNHGVGGGAELLFAEPIPGRASEAFLFSPPGYWKDVYDNPLYPDDFPTDLKSSMSGGATTVTIPGSYTDGHYLMLYNIWEVWRRLDVYIVDGKVHYVNERDVSNIPENINYMIGDDIGFHVEIDVNSAMLSDIDSEINVAVQNGDEIDGEIYVTVEALKDLDSEMFVWFRETSDIDCSIEVKTFALLDSEITIKYDCETDIDSDIVVVRHGKTDIDTEMFVWFIDQTDIDAEVFITHSSEILSEIIIMRHDESAIDAVINIQRTEYTMIDSSIHVFLQGVGDKLFLPSELIVTRPGETSIDAEVVLAAYEEQQLGSEIDIECRDANLNLETDVTIVQKVIMEMDTEVTVVISGVSMEVVTRTEPQCFDDLDMELLVVDIDSKDLMSEIIIMPNLAIMEAVVNTAAPANSNLDCELQIIDKDKSQLDCEVVVVTAVNMEATFDTKGGEESSFETELIIIKDESSEVDSEINVTSVTYMEAVTETKAGNVSEIESTIIISITAKEDLGSEIIIESRTVMETVIQQFVASAHSDFDCEMIVVHAGSGSLSSEITIKAIVFMEAGTEIKGGGQSEIDCEIYPAFFAEGTIDIEMTVNATGVMEAAVFYRNDVYADLDSEIALAVDVQLDSEIYVVHKDDKIVMEVAARTMPTVLKTGTTSAIKDAVCYSYTALTNYGTLTEVSVGRFTGGETFKGLIGFNLAELAIPHDDSMNYFGYETIQKATLKLYVTRPMVEDNVQIKIYRISDGWFETKVNYRALDTLPVYEQVGKIIAPKKMGDISIDITPGFKDWAHKADRQSFMMVVENPLQATKKGIYFSSREGFKSPQLEVEFYKTLPSGDWMDTDSEVFVNPNANLDCEISITNPSKSEIDCSIDIAMQGVAEVALEVDLDILSNNLRSASFDSEIEIIGYPDEAQLDSECFVMFWTQGNLLDSEMDVVRDPYVGCYVYIM